MGRKTRGYLLSSFSWRVKLEVKALICYTRGSEPTGDYDGRVWLIAWPLGRSSQQRVCTKEAVKKRSVGGGMVD